MTGPEHYREAVRLAGAVAEVRNAQPQNDPSDVLALAQVHATLALAAATALGAEGDGRTQPRKDAKAWFDVASECRKEAAA